MSTTIADPLAAHFRDAGKRLQPGDLDAAAKLIGCPLVALQAVLAVETDGSGFDAAGRPSALFEQHVFWRCLAPAKRMSAREQGLAWPVWRPGQYPHTSDGIYDQITRACAIDEVAALKAVSWGIGQLLGEGCASAGFTDVREMVLAAMASEGAQLDMMVQWLIARRLAHALAAEDWPTFANGYNGPNYSVNHYDQKLAAYVSTHQALAAKAAP